MEKLFLHDKSFISTAELNKEITLLYPYFSVRLKSSNATTLVFYEQRNDLERQSRHETDGEPD